MNLCFFLSTPVFFENLHYEDIKDKRRQPGKQDAIDEGACHTSITADHFASQDEKATAHETGKVLTS